MPYAARTRPARDRWQQEILVLDERNQQRLRDGFAGGATTLDLVLHLADRDSPLAAAFAELAREIEVAGGGSVTVRQVKDGEPFAGPSLTLASGARGGIHYLALPEGLEAAPFVDLLLELAREPAPPHEEWARSLARLEQPAEVLVFVSAACPNCAQAVRAAHQVALASPRVTSAIVDAQRSEELAAQFQVKSVPLTLVDGELGMTGAVSPQDLAAKILGRGDAEYGMRVLVSLVETGRMSDSVKRVLEGNGASELAAAWLRSAMSLRMGLLMVVEEVLGANGRSLDGIVGELLSALDAEDAALRGDTADLLGQIGHASAVPALETLLSDPNPDVIEIVTEALEKIRQKDGS
jgi:alkyl hydroperoxide reductase subunit AhpF